MAIFDNMFAQSIHFVEYDTVSYARVYQHDVRAKQAKACDTERAGFLTPTHASNYLKTDGQLIVQGRAAYSNPHLIEAWPRFSHPSINCQR